jgi:hypothetical protein
MKAGAEAGSEGDEPALPTGPEAMEERMQAYLASMHKLAWG